jgi:predicted nucleic acid-binding protein
VTGSETRLIIDASVAIKWVIEEDDSDQADRLRGVDMAAPGLLRIEAANVLRTFVAREAMSANQAVELFALLQNAPVVVFDHDEPLERRALELGLALRHPVYDCVYLALAERLDRVLVTADRRFLRTLSGTEHFDRVVHLADLHRSAPG